jgi:hypothetical protein
MSELKYTDTLSYVQQVRNSSGDPSTPYIDSKYEKLMVTCGVPAVSLSAMIDNNSDFYLDRRFPIAIPGVSMSAAAAVGFLVRCWSIDDAYVYDAHTSEPKKVFRRLLKGVHKKLCPSVSFENVLAMAWTMFKRRHSDINYVRDSVTGTGRHVVCVINKQTTIQYDAPLWLWMDITHIPNYCPKKNSFFPNSQEDQVSYEHIRKSHLDGHIQRICATCSALDTTTQRHRLCTCKKEAYCTVACQRRRWAHHKVTNHRER